MIPNQHAYIATQEFYRYLLAHHLLYSHNSDNDDDEDDMRTMMLK